MAQACGYATDVSWLPLFPTLADLMIRRIVEWPQLKSGKFPWGAPRRARAGGEDGPKGG